jgi:hypothetical protein
MLSVSVDGREEVSLYYYHETIRIPFKKYSHLLIFDPRKEETQKRWYSSISSFERTQSCYVRYHVKETCTILFYGFGANNPRKIPKSVAACRYFLVLAT